MEKEALIRAHDAMLSRHGKRRDILSALEIISQERLYVLQVSPLHKLQHYLHVRESRFFSQNLNVGM